MHLRLRPFKKLQLSTLIVLVLVQPICTIFCFAQKAASEHQKDIAVLTERLVQRALKNSPDLGNTLTTLNADGSWPDINYGDTVTAKWSVHMQRLKGMAIAYRSPTDENYNAPALLNKIDKGFAYIYTKSNRSANWWDMVVGGPNNYMTALILVKGRLSKEKTDKYAAYLQDATPNQAHKGQNRVWVSVITIHKGCIEDNFDLITKGFNSLATTLTIEAVQGAEGIKIDHSFHQHRPQLYSGGYGLSFVREMAEFIAISSATVFEKAFSPDRKSILTNLALRGHQLLAYRNTVDFGSIGRNISRENALGGIDTATLNNLKRVDPQRAKDFEHWKQHLTGQSFPAAYQGNTYFWKSDIMTQRGADYYLSAKVISTRTAGTEMLNGENRKGYNLPLGATNILTHGNEYKGIFPIWDWTKIPGTTVVNNQSSTLLNWYQYGANPFAGAVSNGKNGLIAYEHSYNGVQAKKAYFFIGEAMLCLGSGINALGVQSVITTVNQAWLNGAVTINADDKTQLLEEKTAAFSNLKWVYHDGIGYLFPEKTKLSVSRATQSGTWESINTTGRKDEVKGDVFSAWISHGTAPSQATYQYVVVPAPSLDLFTANPIQKDIHVLKNSEDVQAIQYQSIFLAVFYQPGTVVMKDGTSITSDKKATVLLEKKTGGYQIAIADPLHHQSQLTLTLNKKLKGPGLSFDGSKSKVVLSFPSGAYRGSTQSYFFANP